MECRKIPEQNIKIKRICENQLLGIEQHDYFLLKLTYIQACFLPVYIQCAIKNRFYHRIIQKMLSYIERFTLFRCSIEPLIITYYPEEKSIMIDQDEICLEVAITISLKDLERLLLIIKEEREKLYEEENYASS